MAPLLEKFRRYRGPNDSEMNKPAAIDNAHRQYRASNMTIVFKDLCPISDSTQEEKDTLLNERMEVAKAAKAFQRQKKSFTVENKNPAKQRYEAGVKGYDFALKTDA